VTLLLEAEAPPMRKHRGRWLFLGALLLFVGWVGWCAHLVTSAKSDLQFAQSELKSLTDKDALKALLDGDRKGLLDAQARLHSAKSSLGSPALSVARPLPFLGRQISSARALTGTASGVLDAAVETSAELSPDKRSGMSRIQLLDALGVGAKRMTTAIDKGDLGPPSGLLVSLSNGRADLARQLLKLRKPLDRTNLAVPGLRHMIVGPTKLLVVAANNAQMAAGSGLPLAVTTADVIDGQITVGPFESTWEPKVPEGAVQLTPELQQLWAFATPQDTMLRAIVTPRFDVSAAILAAQYGAAKNTPVDGVLMIDIVGLQKLVAVGGAAADPNAIPADKVIDELMHNQYLSLDDGQPEINLQRKERLGQVARAAVTDLLNPKLSAVDLGRALSDAAAGRHVLLWSRLPDEQLAMQALRVDGGLAADSVSVSLLNAGANKLDWYVKLASKVTVGPVANNERQIDVEVTVSSQVPDGLPRYVAGPGPGVPVAEYGDYIGYFTINVPGAATKMHLGDESPVIVAGPDGPTRTIGQLLIVKRNTTRVVTFSFTLPADFPALRIEPSGRYPAIGWSAGAQSWTDDGVNTILLL
jgi:Protein of unknown function (DUF4012)